MSGTPAKRTRRADRRHATAREILNEWKPGFDPLIRLAEIAENTDNPLNIRVKCYETINEYVLPKRKAVDVNVHQDRNITLVWDADAADAQAPAIPTSGEVIDVKPTRRRLV